MGVRNKERRAAKARRRASARAQRAGDHRRRDTGARWDEPRPASAEQVRALLHLVARGHGDDALIGGAVAVAVLARSDERLVERESEAVILSIVAALWAHGWQPGEVVRHARRADARAGRLVATAVAADHISRSAASLHAQWVAAIEALDLPVVDAAGGWLRAFAAHERLDRERLVALVVTVLGALGGLGPLPTIVPPPGDATSRPAASAGGGSEDPVLVKVRALLAQAESTTFAAEAEAFTAKAQELMARHAIDVAVLWAGSGRDERPTTIRLPIDDPYADIKYLLLQSVADHSRAKAVYHPSYALASVIGFASDVAATELLYTSLLVQAQTALQVEAAGAGPGGRARSRGFRSSFLMAFTHRVGERLEEITAAVERGVQTEHGSTFLPALVARHDAIEDAVAETFGELRSSPVRGGSDAAGWARGRFAADLARLDSGQLAG